jgi:hypothetical protein
MISVRDLGDGTYAVIDGMHRVTTLQTLQRERHQGIDYDKVIHSTVIISSDLLNCQYSSYQSTSVSHLLMSHTTQIWAVVYFEITPTFIMLAIAQSTHTLHDTIYTSTSVVLPTHY